MISRSQKQVSIRLQFVKSNKAKLLIITNLFPSPWEPNRATFNKQQFNAIENDFDIYYLIPVSFIDWIKNRKQIVQSDRKRFVPYFFTPKVGRRFYAFYMFISMLCHSGLWVRKINPEKTLASWAYPDAVASNWLSKLFKADFYFKVHGSDIDMQCQYKARAKQVVKMSRNARGILSVSQALAEKMIALGINKSKINVIYNGVNHDAFNQQTNRPYSKDYLLFIGNLKHDKGVVELIEGFNQVSQKHPELHLVFAGNGVMRTHLEQLARKYDCAEKVTFLGSVNHADIVSWLNNCSALALPSYHEGVPNVILEAMSCGKPVIATNIGGIPEVVDESICGKLIEIQSSTAVADAIDFILLNKWNKEKIQQHSQQFSWAKNKQQLVQLLTETRTAL